MGRRGLPLAVIALALMAAVPARAATQPDMFGVSVNRIVNDDFTPAHWDAPFTAIHDAGITSARTDAFWMWAEPHRPTSGAHSYSWGMLDQVAGSLARHHLRWRPILDYSATWASSDQGDYHAPPTSNDDYAAYAAAFAARYGAGGAFWQAHPELDPLPVTSYEIWNEENGAWFWRPAPDAAAYADMYMEARAAIRAADPEARVVVGGLVPDPSFLEAMYAARPELRGQVDAVGLHPYARTADGVIANVRALRRMLDQLGEPGVPIDVTEVGWPTSGSGSSIVLDEDARAAALETVASSLSRSDCGVEGVVPYTWTTPERNSDDIEDWYGIRHPDGSATPSSDAFARVVGRWATDPVTDASRDRICHPPDADLDGTPDASDQDDDNDGVGDVADPFPLDAAESADGDHDGIGDNADGDDDNDGVYDILDAFPHDPAESADTDLDGVGDRADADDDGDGLSDSAERALHTSSRDRDSDDDGIPDGAERRTSPARADSDRDGLPDGVEAGYATPVADPPGPALGTDPRRFHRDRDPHTRTSAVRRDTDGDGLADGHEDRNRNGRRDRGETDPRRRDSDGDRVSDRRDRHPLDRRRR